MSQFRLFDIGYAWYWFVLCFVIDDFAYYVFHRSAHRVRWFWASHVIHHSSQHYNLSTALRQTWTGFISLAFIFRLPLFLIGFPPAMVFFVGGVNLIYQFWIHTEVIGRMPRWFEAVMNTPSHHRVHHATNARYLDRNYAGRLHRLGQDGSAPSSPSATTTGRVTASSSISAASTCSGRRSTNGSGSRRMCGRAPGLRAKLGYIVMPPGWSHDGSRDTSEIIKAALASRAKQQARRGREWKKPISSSSAADRRERRCRPAERGRPLHGRTARGGWTQHRAAHAGAGLPRLPDRADQLAI